MLAVGDFFKDLFRDEKKWNVVILVGDDAYLWRELKSGIKKLNWEQREFFVRSEKDWGPEIFDSTRNVSLFSNQTVVFVDAIGAKEKSLEPLWEKASECENLFVRVESLKKIPKGVIAVDFQIPQSERAQWIQRMAKVANLELTAERKRALEELDLTPLELDQVVQLWALGGDTWWNAMSSQYSKRLESSASQGKEAFEWVDAVLAGNSRQAILKLRAALAQGQDAFMMLGLLAKSLKVGVQILNGQKPDAHEFVVKKIQTLLRDARKKKRLLDVVEKAAQIDLAIKSSGLKPEAALEKLSS